MSDLIKRLREVWPRSAICNEAADALENPMHAALMVAAKACAGMMNNPAIEIYGEPNAQDCADMLEKLASEYPPSVCVPVEELKKLRDTVVLLHGKLKEADAMFTAARKP